MPCRNRYRTIRIGPLLVSLEDAWFEMQFSRQRLAAEPDSLQEVPSMNAYLAANILYCAMFASMSALSTELVPPQVDALPGSSIDQTPSPISEQVNPSKLEPMMIEPSAEQQMAAYRRDLAECDSQ